MTRSVVHSGHEPGPRAIQSALCGYRAAGVITVGYTGLSRANSAGPGGVFRKRQLPGGLRSLMDARANGEVAPKPAVRRASGTDGTRPLAVARRRELIVPIDNLWWPVPVRV